MCRGLKYCAILPAFNEARHLAEVVKGIPEWVEGILIVDDASDDDTLAVANALDDPRVSVIHHEKNQGVGGAMVTGFRAAMEKDYDVAIKMDADGQMDYADLPALVWPIEEDLAEYVKGNRFLRSGRPRSMPAMRWIGNVALSFLTKIASGYWHVFDPQCGFIVIATPVLRRLDLGALARDYFFENDMLIRLNVIDARVVEVDVAALYADETSHVRVGRILLAFPWRLFKRAIWRFIKRHVVRDFGLVALLTSLGGMLMLFGVIFGIYHWVQSAQTGIPTNTGSVMIAVIPLILGAQMLLQALSIEVQSSPGAAETRIVTHEAMRMSSGTRSRRNATSRPPCDDPIVSDKV